jgi:hypothetical protein
MMLDKDTLEFVRTGMARYPDARETIAYFEQMIQKSIIEALQPSVDGSKPAINRHLKPAIN